MMETRVNFKYMMGQFAPLIILLGLIISCNNPGSDGPAGNPLPKGKLFIIGGGSRPASMITELIKQAGIRDEGYGLILPMSSIEPDSSIFYAKLQFTNQGITNVKGMHFANTTDYTHSRVDSIIGARLIYISGGDQNRFMASVVNTPLFDAIRKAYEKGAVIAGTSAGAAVMSRKMITGNEKKHSDYSSTFRHIQPDNIEFGEGLGLLENVIVDQHFVKRSRYNRLISAVMEIPEALGIGIDESTAIIVSGDSARVVGNSLVLLFRNKGKTSLKDSIMGARDIHLEVLLPGDKFQLTP